MKIIQPGPNQTIVILKDGSHIFVSYKTPVAAYVQEARDGMVVSTNHPEAVAFRRYVMEWLMMHHPLEGKKEAMIHSLDPSSMFKLYGTEALFIFDPSDISNV